MHVFKTLVKQLSSRSNVVSSFQAFKSCTHTSALSCTATKTHRILSLNHFKEGRTLCKAAEQIKGSGGRGAQHQEQELWGLCADCLMWLIPFCLPVSRCISVSFLFFLSHSVLCRNEKRRYLLLI